MGEYASIKLTASVDPKSAEAIRLFYENDGLFDPWDHVSQVLENCPDWVGAWAAIDRSSQIPRGALVHGRMEREYGWKEEEFTIPTDEDPTWSFCCSIKSNWWVAFFIDRILPLMITKPCVVIVYDDMSDEQDPVTKEVLPNQKG
jgi:hypothetical protein